MEVKLAVRTAMQSLRKRTDHLLYQQCWGVAVVLVYLVPANIMVSADFFSYSNVPKVIALMVVVVVMMIMMMMMMTVKIRTVYESVTLLYS